MINVPIGIAVAAGALLLVDDTRHRDGRPGIDVDGLQLSALGFELLVFGLIEGSTLGWWAPKAPLRMFGPEWPVTAAHPG